MTFIEEFHFKKIFLQNVWSKITKISKAPKISSCLTLGSRDMQNSPQWQSTQSLSDLALVSLQIHLFLSHAPYSIV